METIHLGRQPIVDAKGDIFAYELLYRDSNEVNEIQNDRYASAAVIGHVLNKFGTKKILGGYKGFIKIDEKFLLNDLIFSIPNDFFVFSLLDSVEMNERVLERIEQLHAKEYTIGINDVSLSEAKLEELTPALRYLSFVKVNIDRNVTAKTKDYIEFLKEQKIHVIATKVETHVGYETAKRFGCEYYQGYFFAQPKIVEGAKCDPSQMNVLRLYNLLMQDTNIDEITDEFEHNYALTVQLLQFMNSGAFHFRNKISSIHHVITLIGRKPLAQWLMLMIYSKSTAKCVQTTPVMLMIKSRTDLMENILKLIKPKAGSNALGEAYFVGVLSMLDTIFGVPIEVIMEEMNVSDVVKNAILKEEGGLGKIYALVQEIEVFNTQAMEAFSERYKVDLQALKKIVFDSIESVNEFEASVNSHGTL